MLWPLTDHQGTVRDVAEYDEVTGETEIVNHITYDAFGNVTGETNAAVDHLFCFTGREGDEESDLYYYRARFYDPALGQFLSEDPLGLEAGDRNLRRYVGNGPTFLLDPSGLQQSVSDHDVVRDAAARLNAHYNPIRGKVSDNARRHVRNRLYELRKALAYDPEVLARDVYWRLMQVNTTLRVLRRGQGPLEATLRRASLPYSREYANDGRHLSTEERLASVLPAVDELYQHQVLAAPLVTLRDELTTFIRENGINEPRRPCRLANPDELARGNLNATVFSLLPVLGEAYDIDTLTSTDAPAWERSVALGSLAINIVTLGFAPNAGGLSRGAKRELDILSELAVTPRSYGDIMEDVARVGLVEAPRRGFGAVGLWNTIDEVVDPSVVRQLNGGSCGPSCGAMLLRGTGNPAAQSAIALRQGAVMSDDAARLARAMNDLAGTPGVWRGGFVNVFTNPTRTFGALSRNGSFATTLRTPSMRVSHMVVVDGLDDTGRVVIRDPSGGTRYLMDWDEFLRVWEGQSIYR